MNDYGQFQVDANTPHFVGEVVATKKNFDINPNPDFPPYVVKTLHFVELRRRRATNQCVPDSQEASGPYTDDEYND